MFKPYLNSQLAPVGWSRLASAGVLVAEAAIATVALSIFASASPQLFTGKSSHPAQPAPVVKIQLPAYPPV
jgi:hypothetical protein